MHVRLDDSFAFAASALLSVISLLPLASRAEETARQKTTGYPAVEDVPPRPDKPAMTADELDRSSKELSAARDRQVPKGKAGERRPQNPDNFVRLWPRFPPLDR